MICFVVQYEFDMFHSTFRTISIQLMSLFCGLYSCDNAINFISTTPGSCRNMFQ